MVLEHSLNCILFSITCFIVMFWQSAAVHLVPCGMLGNVCAWGVLAVIILWERVWNRLFETSCEILLTCSQIGRIINIKAFLISYRYSDIKSRELTRDIICVTPRVWMPQPLGCRFVANLVETMQKDGKAQKVCFHSFCRRRLSLGTPSVSAQRNCGIIDLELYIHNLK